MHPCRARDMDSYMMPESAAVFSPGMAVPYIVRLLTHVKCLQP